MTMSSKSILQANLSDSKRSRRPLISLMSLTMITTIIMDFKQLECTLTTPPISHNPVMSSTICLCRSKSPVVTLTRTNMSPMLTSVTPIPIKACLTMTKTARSASFSKGSARRSSPTMPTKTCMTGSAQCAKTTITIKIR